MSDKFLELAKEEIQSELDNLERIIAHCENDDGIYKKSRAIREHVHKIKGLAPMIGQENVGEIARVSDNILKHIISNGVLPGSYSFMIKTIVDMRKIFQGFDAYDMLNFKKLIHDKFPSVSEL